MRVAAQVRLEHEELTMSCTVQSAKDYVAGEAGYLYPGVGDALAPGGAAVLLLTKGGVTVSGTWSKDGRFLAWSPMPRKSNYNYPDQGGEKPGSGTLLLLSRGGICILGPWTCDGRYLGWAPMPKRDHSKEAELAALSRPVGRWRIAA